MVVQVDYIIEEPWALRLRVPYETKKRSAAIEIIDPATASDIEAMQRNLDLHHGETLLSGVRDLDLLASWHSHHWRIDGDFLAISFGTSLPTGETEENPYLAAASAEAHEHIQFGSGSYGKVGVEFVGLEQGRSQADQIRTWWIEAPILRDAFGDLEVTS